MAGLQNQIQKRQVAYKVRVSDILKSVSSKEIMSFYIKVNDLSVSRVNIIATLVYKAEDVSYSSAMIDDGTGRISLRSFDKKFIFSKSDVGDIVLTVGKIREFNNERYIIPEIVKKIENYEWANVRSMELKNNAVVDVEESAGVQNFVEENDVVIDELFSLIRKLDLGDGVLIEDILRECKRNSAENLLGKMLEKGDVFEIKPGKIKILE